METNLFQWLTIIALAVIIILLVVPFWRRVP